MMLFRITSPSTIEPLAPLTAAADNAAVFTLEQAAIKTGKPAGELRDLWRLKWGGVIPEERVTGEPIGDPLSRPVEVKQAALLLTDEQRDKLIHEMLYPQLPPDAWEAFKIVCAQRRLSVYCRHLYPEYRYDGGADAMKLVIITTIEAIRLLARRTGECAGRTDIEWAGEDGTFLKAWDSAGGPPKWARCGVKRRGDDQPVNAVVEWHSYVPYVQTWEGSVVDPYWQQWSAQQLGKCAEVAAYRANFPEELDGIYTKDEMRQADNFGPPSPPAAPQRVDEDSQVEHEEVDEQEFYDLLETAFEDEQQRQKALNGFKTKYSKLWRRGTPDFARSVMRDLRAMIDERRRAG